MKTESFNKSFIASLALPAFVCYASFWFGLGATRLWDRDEPRNARCAAEMLERNDWVVPYFNDQLRTHKPILLYWMEMTAYQVFGENAFAARLPSAFMGTMSLVGIGILAASFLGRLSGFWAASSLGTCAMMVVACRAATPDAALICTSCWGVVGLVMHWNTQAPKRTAWWWIGFCSLGLAVLAKGPVGIVLPSIVVGLWCVIQEFEKAVDSPVRRRSKPETRWLAIREGTWLFLKSIWVTLGRLQVFTGLLFAISVAAPWYIWVGFRTDGEWLRGFFWEHNFSRAVNAMEGHRGGLWYYPAAALVGLFPWSLLLIPIVAWTWNNLRRPLAANDTLGKPLQQMTLLGVIWIGVYIGCFSIARTKLPSYITPCYPGAALLIGGFLSHWAVGLKTLTKRMMWSGALVHAVAGVAISIGLVVLSKQSSIASIRWDTMWPMVLGGAAIAMVLLADPNRQRAMPSVLVSTFAILLGSIFGVIAPKVDSNRSDLNTMSSMDSDFKWMSVGTIEPSWVFYMRNPIVEVPADPAGILESSARIANHLKSSNGRLLVREENWAAIQIDLQKTYGVEAISVDRFPVFLKNRDLLVIRLVTREDLNLSQHNSSNRR